MPNSTNPILTVTEARVVGQEAQLDLLIENPSERDLVLTGIDYTITLGPLPVAQDRWTGGEPLPMQGSARFTLVAPFDSPPMDPTASQLEFSGVMSFDDQTVSGNMALTEATFNETAEVRR